MIRVFWVLIFFSKFIFAAESIGKAISLEGDVIHVRENQNLTPKPGDLIFEGDQISTGKRSSARFLLQDRSIIDLKENSRFVFKKLRSADENREAEFNLDFGRVRASVNKKIESGKKYEIKTKATVFAVRGTDFSVTAAETPQSALTVFEGTVQGEGQGFNESVDAGFILSADAGTFKKTQLSKSEIERIFTASRAEDMTFNQNLVVGDFRVSRNFGASTLQTLAKIISAPSVQIPKDAFKIPGVNQLNASAVSPGILNYVITDVGVRIQ